MAANGSVSGDESAPAAVAPSSPKNKVKFLCSHGGKILPRPADGHLKYVGGETRVVSVPRSISFSELMEKLSALFEGNMILKYQLAAEDLDALVSVTLDEDLKHMFEEYDRHAGEGTPRLRAFLFPSVPTLIETQQVASLDPHALEQRYIDAVNGVVRMNLSLSPGTPKAFGPYSPSRATFSISSACSSPKSPSPDSNPGDTMSQEAASMRSYHGHSALHHMHKVHSSPALHVLGNTPAPCNGHGAGSAPQMQYNHYYSSSHHHHHSHQHPPHFSYHPPRPLQLEPYRGSGAPAGRADIGRSPLNQGVGPYYLPGRNYRTGGFNNYGYADEHGAYSLRRPERADSVPHSPRTAM
ncbi:uncharacterized protein LOC116204773 [Punica granatum]|uniref:PB1 domain-containing protein n=2 Tax=Punica granatum TaxID=22663 RepID=A0A218XIU0_PUNGR|nr:uncharacterized protein LOC116204773 [Punica granatum]OWM84873.1 hypothetical protein CDL15_Pgr027660 [Punica granatum]PKI74882.1 hypothetical protein CRG98_004654 [Punica granatum]